MWKLIKIQATNLCAFKEFDYTILQNKTTLVFGNNMDNDSQGSNGSGKSALIEAIALALTGDTLRKVKIEEIINDAEEQATVCVDLKNDASNQVMTINRCISRGNPQQIQIILQNGPYDEDVEEIVQSSVADYNQYVLDMLGLTKDEIYSNYILCKYKYQSFLLCSDRDKKEIINKFSNGNLVDDAIKHLQNDIIPVQEVNQKAESDVAMAAGRLDAITEQIDNARLEAEERNKSNLERIRSWRDAITNLRSDIRNDNDKLQSNDKRASELEKCDLSLRELEDTDCGFTEVYTGVVAVLNRYSLQQINNYSQLISYHQEQLADYQQQMKNAEADLDSMNEKLNDVTSDYDKVSASVKAFNKGFDDDISRIKGKMTELKVKIDELSNEQSNIQASRVKISRSINMLEGQLAGTIKCPKCSYEFTLGNTLDVDNARKQLSKYEQQMENYADKYRDCENSITSLQKEGKDLRREYDSLNEKRSEKDSELSKASSALFSLKRDIDRVQTQLQTIDSNIKRASKAIQDSRKNMFDEAFDILDVAIKDLNADFDTIETRIKMNKGKIASYEESIRQLENVNVDDMIERLNKSKAEYEENLQKAVEHQESVSAELNKLKTQEAVFVQFKTHLANSKIEALSQITNEFLAQIGSDIRISFSGYTILKSGKVRDKISISLIRDGVDCGSFGKFSAGEQARVNLASILAMHKLTNVTCEDDKGLDLLILDEILEATDEAGLANIFEALNKLQITSLVVSHGQIAENYPYTLVINKENGISFING